MNEQRIADIKPGTVFYHDSGLGRAEFVKLENRMLVRIIEKGEGR